jgi:hypothetical protein
MQVNKWRVSNGSSIKRRRRVGLVDCVETRRVFRFRFRMLVLSFLGLRRLERLAKPARLHRGDLGGARMDARQKRQISISVGRQRLADLLDLRQAGQIIEEEEPPVLQDGPSIL